MSDISDVSSVITAYHSHGAVRVEYYVEFIAKGGITNDPDYKFEKLDRRRLF